MKKLNFILIIGVFLTNIGMAQTQWINYTNGDYVNAIASEGNDIWVGTNGGLVKIDKTTGNTVFYNHANSGLPDNSILSLAIDGNGTKWIGTYGGGLARFDGTTWIIYNTSNSGLPSNDVRSLAIDGNGTKWMGTYGGGLARFDGTTWTVYNEGNSGMPSNYVRSLAIDGNGTKWIGTYGGGLACFDGTTWIVYNMSNSGLPSNDVTSLAIDSSGTKWIGTGDGGLAAFNENGISSVNKQLSSENDMIVYPNPSHDQLTVIARGQSSITDLSIIDMMGKVRWQARFSHVIPNDSEESQMFRFTQRDKVIVNVKFLPAGLYILKVTGDKGTEVTKFIKE